MENNDELMCLRINLSDTIVNLQYIMQLQCILLNRIHIVLHIRLYAH